MVESSCPPFWGSRNSLPRSARGKKGEALLLFSSLMKEGRETRVSFRGIYLYGTTGEGTRRLTISSIPPENGKEGVKGRGGLI